jgi:DNA invertase Pin-like site-specific DNA recombinase
MRAVIYGRVSTETQEEGRALEFQIKKCQDYCVLKGYEIYKVIQDVESGGKDLRDGFIELQKEIEIKSFDVLVVYESSRISRITRTMLDFVFKLQSNDIKFVSISQPELDTTTHTGMLFFQIQASLGEYERKQISTRVKSSKWQRAKEGNWQGGNTPLGYKNTKGGIIVIEEEAEVVRSIFNYYIETKSMHKTSKFFTKHISSIKWILENKFYLGIFTFGRKENNINTGKVKIHKSPTSEFEGKHEAIIDVETFNIAQELLNTGRPHVNKGFILIFSGLIICPDGKKMYKNSKRKNNNIFYYYRSYKGKYSLPYEILEDEIIKDLLKLNKLKELKKNDIQIDKVNNSIKLLKSKLEALDKRRQKYIDAYTMDAITSIELSNYTQSIKKEKDDIINDIELQKKLLVDLNTGNESEVFDTLKEVLENMEDMDRRDIQELFRMLIKKIELTSLSPIKVNIILNL